MTCNVFGGTLSLTQSITYWTIEASITSATDGQTDILLANTTLNYVALPELNTIPFYLFYFIIWIVHQVQKKKQEKRERQTDNRMQSARGQIIHNARKVTDSTRSLPGSTIQNTQFMKMFEYWPRWGVLPPNYYRRSMLLILLMAYFYT